MRETGIRIFDVFVVFLGLTVLGYFSMDWALQAVVHNRPERMVPDLVNKSVDAALDLVSPLNLSLRKAGEEFNDKVPVGAIVRQVPPAGTSVREGKTIGVVVSQGGETVFVPTLTGLPLRNAEMLLRRRQLNLGEMSESFSVRMKKGRVLSQDPPAESPVEQSAMVSVVVSAGPPPPGVVLMPEFRQKDLQEALEWAAGLGVGLSVSTDTASLFPNGTVLSQEPPTDTVLNRSAKIKLLVSGRPRAAGEERKYKTLRYEVSQGRSESLLRIVVVDPYGEREVFNGIRSPGSKVELKLPDTGTATRARIFVNGILIEEREL